MTFSANAAEVELTLSESKAHYTYEIVKQILWPNEKDINHFKIGFVGSDKSVYRAFQERVATKVRGKTFSIESFNEHVFESGGYNLIYIVDNRRSLNEELFKRSVNVLIITDGRVNDEFRLINLLENRDQIRIRFNRENLIERGFSISANLLAFAGTKEDLTEELIERESSLKKLLSEVAQKEKELAELNRQLDENSQLLISAEKEIKDNNFTIAKNQKQLETLRNEIESSTQSIRKNIQDINNQKALIKVKQQEIQEKEQTVASLLNSIEENKQILQEQVGKIQLQRDMIINKNETITEQREWLVGILIVSSVFIFMSYVLWKTNGLRKKANLELKQLNTRLYELATTDDLTSLYNRRYFLETTQKELFREQRNYSRSVLLMIDIDRFKSVNDTYGHPMGDEAIRSVAQILKQGMRKYDIVGRLGGEEYAMLLMDCNLEQGTDIARRLCEQVAKHDIVCDNVTINITVSIGLSELDVNDEKIEQAINRADKALYAAKEAGRNQVVAH